MLVAFRSIVVAAKAIVLNLLSVAAAYGVLVLVFQHGVGKGLLGFSSTAGIDPVVPLLLFVILFGLSMDYHVFILSRIREMFDRGASMDEAVSHGIKSTAGVVTSAAIVMVAVFSIFATLSMLFFKQFGVGLAAAILIDATIVRGVLLPATMKLLGDWNWYLPSWLEWLPGSSGYEPEPVPTPEPAPEPSRSAPARASGARLSRSPRITGLVAGRARRARPRLPALRLRRQAGLRARRGAGRGADPAACSYATENGSYAADCGTLVVPENRHDPQSRLIALPVTRIRARSAHPGRRSSGSQGGPGITQHGVPGGEPVRRHARRRARRLPRSRRLRRGSTAPRSTVGAASTRRLPRRRSRSARTPTRSGPAPSGFTADGVDLAGYGLPQRVDDLEAARQALGYDRIDLVSESAGTRTAMIYAWRYPREHPPLGDDRREPARPLPLGREDDRRADRPLRRALRAGRRPAARGRPTSPRRCARALGDLPDRWWFLPIKQGNVQAASFFGLMNATTDGAGPLSGPMTIDTLLSAGKGDASGAWFCR